MSYERTERPGQMPADHWRIAAGWDNAESLTLPPPLRIMGNLRGAHLGFPRGTRLRIEDFGCYVQVGRFVWAFNKPATALLCAAGETPASIEEVDDLTAAFLTECVEGGILVPVHPDSITRPVTYSYLSSPSDHLAAPLTLELEVTNKCFRQCTYCAYGSGPTPLIPVQEELKTEDWIALLEQAAAAGVAVVEFTGGDPFARQDFATILLTADRLGIATLINSDLSVLSHDRLEILGQLAHLVAVQTSLDGADAATCDTTRGSGGFKTLMRQLRRLVSAKCPVTVGTTVHSGNYSQVSSIARIVADEGAEGYYIGPMYPAGRAASLSGMLVGGHQWDIAVGQFVQALKGDVVKPAHHRWNDLLASTDENPVREQPYISSRADRGLRIDPRGIAYVSAKLSAWHPRFSAVGDVCREGLLNVWRDSALLSQVRAAPYRPNPFGGVDVRDIQLVARAAAQ